MALSVLTCGKQHGLYNSKTDSFVDTGTEPYLEVMKHIMEKKEQDEDNRKHFDGLREQYLKQLIMGGNTPDQATNFLKERMPFLFN